MKDLWDRLLRAPLGLGLGLGLSRGGATTPAEPSNWTADSTTITADSTTYTADGSTP